MSASLDKGVRVLKEVIDAPIASYFNSCVHCGMCAEACLFYTETGDPKYTPIHKLEPLRRLYEQEYTLLGRLAKMVGLSKPVTDAELAEWQELVLQQLHPVRPLLGGLSGRQRHRLHGAQDPRRHVGIRSCARRAQGCGHPHGEHRQPDGHQAAGREGADEARRGRLRHRDSARPWKARNTW